MTSLRRYLTRSILGAIIALGGVGGVALYFAARETAVDQFDAALRARASAISSLAEPTPIGVKVEVNDQQLRGFDARRPRSFFEIWDKDGHRLARSESLESADLEHRQGLAAVPHVWTIRLPDGLPGRAVGFTFALKEESSGPQGPLTLIVATTSAGLDEDLLHLMIVVAVTGIALLAATLWIVPRVLAKGLAPLERLEEQANAIDSRSLATRFPVDTLPVELRPIAIRLNDLLARIEQSFERERRFSSDLAHELRTPLAELRSAAECALKWPASRDGATDRDTLAIATWMEGMVSHMLALARSEQGQIAPRWEQVALSEVVASRWARLAPKADERGLKADLELKEGLVDADPALLRSILDNVLENAVEYAAIPGTLRIAVDPAGPALIRISNTVADLAPADLPRIFERFWRKESARSGGRHLGLGLPLSRAFAEAMRWRLEGFMPSANVLEIALVR